MLIGPGFQTTPLTLPTLSSSTEVNSVEEALSLYPSATLQPVSQIQDDLVKQGWSRVAFTTTEEYFLLI